MLKRREPQSQGGRIGAGAVVKWVSLLLAAALLLSLVPLYAAAQYSYAGVDDYRYGTTTHAVWEETGSFAKTAAEAARVARETYDTWQGSLSAIFLMALQPGIFGDGWYWLSTALLLTVLTLALIALTMALCCGVFGMDAWEALGMSALTAICCIQFVPVPVESYYWFNGGVYYTFYFSLSLLAAAVLARRRERKRAVQWVLLALLTPLIGTGNLVTGLLCCVGLTLYALWTFLWKRERDFAVLVALVLLLGTFAVNVFAPGNGVRQAEHPENMQAAAPAVLFALRDGAVYTLDWLAGPATFLLLMGVPLLWRWAGRAKLRFRYPPLVSAASFLLLSAGFAPNEYAQRFAGEARVIDIQFYLFVLLLLVNIVWYTGWIRQHVRLPQKSARRIACALLAACALAAGALSVQSRNVAAVTAVRLQLNGSGAAYAQAWERRLLALRDPARDPVTLEAFTRQPPLLCMVDIAVDESGEYYWYNEQLAAYFGKTRVLREP